MFFNIISLFIFKILFFNALITIIILTLILVFVTNEILLNILNLYNILTIIDILCFFHLLF